jgi:hypothetical protein
MVGNPLFVNHVYYKSKGTKVGYGHQEVKCGCGICTLCNRGEHIKIHCFGQHGWDMFMHELLTKWIFIQSHCHIKGHWHVPFENYQYQVFNKLEPMKAINAS